MQWRRSEFEKQCGDSWWGHITYELFGEWKFVGWLLGIVILAKVIFWGTIIFVAGHFISKYW